VPRDPRTWHIITGEYPPEIGGVADYTAAVAAALAGSGDAVHVWTGGRAGVSGDGVRVHRVLGSFGRADLSAAASGMTAGAGEARVLVQWVPHAFGRRGLNVGFPLWVRRHATARATPIDVMVHEPFLPFRGSAAQRAAAAAQRAMTALVVRSAARVFVGTPAWIELCAGLGAEAGFTWTPIPSGVPASATAADAADFRGERRLAEGPLIGVFGKAGVFRQALLDRLAAALARVPGAHLLLMGDGSDAARARLAGGRATLDGVVAATGALDPRAMSAAIRACDVMFQPYPDGVCARHSSASALLAHGCAVVTSQGRLTEQVWADSRAVQLVPADDEAGLVSGAVSLAGDRAARERLSAAALELYRARFDVRHTVAALQA
jgi:glycosyltransferase involved in cell wall biosynthesis